MPGHPSRQGVGSRIERGRRESERHAHVEIGEAGAHDDQHADKPDHGRNYAMRMKLFSQKPDGAHHREDGQCELQRHRVGDIDQRQRIIARAHAEEPEQGTKEMPRRNRRFQGCRTCLQNDGRKNDEAEYLTEQHGLKRRHTVVLKGFYERERGRETACGANHPENSRNRVVLVGRSRSDGHVFNLPVRERGCLTNTDFSEIRDTAPSAAALADPLLWT